MVATIPIMLFAADLASRNAKLGLTKVKKIIVVLISFLSVSSYASIASMPKMPNPVVGDFFNYNSKSYKKDAITGFHYISFQIVGLNETTNDLKLKQRVELEDGRVSDSFLYFNKYSFKKNYYFDPILRCDDLKGEIVTITVAAGTFKSCKTIKTEDGDFKITEWLARVPKLTVKLTYETKEKGIYLKRELIEYGWGK